MTPHGGLREKLGPGVSAGPLPAPGTGGFAEPAGPLAGIDLRRRRRARLLARALGRGGPRSRRGRLRDPVPSRARRHVGEAGVHPRRRGPRCQVDVSRPAIVRAAPPSPTRRVRRRGRPRRARAGPPPGLRAAADRRPDGARRPRGGLGERVESALPGPANRPADRRSGRRGDDTTPARRRGARPGPRDGLRDRTPPDDPAVPRGARRVRGARRADGPRRGSSTSAPAPGSSRSPPGCSEPERSWR